jgi:hypothetical protein
VVIKLAKGRYDFYADSAWQAVYYMSNTNTINPRKLGILVKNKQQVVIDGQGSEFIFHGHMQPVTIDNSENITLRNFTIDWDKPLTAEARVVEATPQQVLLQIDTAQFPFTVAPNGVTFAAEGWQAGWRVSGGSWLIEYDTNHVIPPHTGDFGCINGDLKNVVYQLAGPGLLSMQGAFTKVPAVGNYLIMRHSTRDHAGIFLHHSRHISLHHINLYHTAGLGILSQYTENITITHVNIEPNPRKKRYLSSHDDGLHFMGCKGQITVDSCRFGGLMDDPINIHGTGVPVVQRVNDSTLLCRFAHHQSTGLKWGIAGDTIAFIQSGPMITESYSLLKKFVPLSTDSFLLQLATPLPTHIGPGYSLENLGWTPHTTITNCMVGSCRARGFLISTPGKVVVENNVFETSGSAILIAGDANYWFESGAVKDVTIRNNTFKAPCNSSPYQFCEAVISIMPEIPKPDSSKPFHRNITIESNRFFPSDYPVLYAFSVAGLRFINNHIERSYLYQPWHSSKHMIVANACKQVQITGNFMGKDVLGRDVELRRMPNSELNVQPDIKTVQ